MGGVGGVAAGEYGAAADDGESQDWVEDVVGGVEEDAVAGLDAVVAEAGDVLLDEVFGLDEVDAAGGVGGVDEDLRTPRISGVVGHGGGGRCYRIVDVGIWTGLVEDPAEDVCGGKDSRLGASEDGHGG